MKIFQSDMLDRLDTLRRNRELCDVVLYVNNREIYAHQTVLAALSPRLCQMFGDCHLIDDQISDDSMEDNTCEFRRVFWDDSIEDNTDEFFSQSIKINRFTKMLPMNEISVFVICEHFLDMHRP